LQETVQTMYQKYEDSLPINDFVAWGIQIAKFKILNHRKKAANSHVAYDDRLFESCIALIEEEQSNDYDGRMERLGQCLNRLRPRAKELVKLRYYQDLKPRQISLLLGLSVANIYKAMSRIHGELLECMSGR
jgi:RNA polymerase sigma-70 factor, ECF subfamily